jgi:hypothetical protein
LGARLGAALPPFPGNSNLELIAMRDMMNNVKLETAFAPKAAVTDDTAQTSTICDTRGCESVVLSLITGVLSDSNATFAVVITESDAVDSESAPTSLTGGTAVADDDLVGTEVLAGFTFADDSETRKIGYRGGKRWIQATVTPTGNTGNLFLAGSWIKSVNLRPTVNP